MINEINDIVINEDFKQVAYCTEDYDGVFRDIYTHAIQVNMVTNKKPIKVEITISKDQRRPLGNDTKNDYWGLYTQIEEGVAKETIQMVYDGIMLVKMCSPDFFISTERDNKGLMVRVNIIKELNNN